MKYKKMKLALKMLMCFVFVYAADAQAQTVCSVDQGTHGGYEYELWKDYGDACMTLKEGGTFSCEWSDVGNVLFTKGLQFNEKPYQDVGEITVKYSAEYQPDGISYLGVYGWFTDPLVEYYIVESWGTWRPPGGEPIGTIEVDGGTYEITKYIKNFQIDSFLTQYWSVRTERRTSGTVSVSKHFEKWASLDLTMGNLYEVTFLVEGYQSNGWADVTSMTIGVDVDDDDDDYKEISAPFFQNGTGTYKWKMSSISHFVNSWNLDSLVINDVDLTNVWVSADKLPEKHNGYYYIDYQASFPWSHVEFK